MNKFTKPYTMCYMIVQTQSLNFVIALISSTRKAHISFHGLILHTRIFTKKKKKNPFLATPSFDLLCIIIR